MRKFFSSLQMRLLSLVLLAFLPILGLTIYEGLEQRQQAMTRAQETALSLVNIAASDQGRLMEGIRQLLVAIARFPAVRDHDEVACSAFVADLQKQNPIYSQLGAALPNGDVFCSGVRSSQPLNCGDRPFFQEVLRTRDFVIGDYIIMRGSGKPGIAAVYPALDETGQVQAVVFAGVDMAWLDGFLAEAQTPEGSTLTLVDGAGTIVTHQPDPEPMRGQTLPASLLQPILSQREGLADLPGPDGVQRLYAFTPFCCPERSHLYLVVGVPKSVAFAEANRTMARNLSILGVVTLLALVMARFGARLLVLKPVQSILDVIKRYDAGDFSARTRLEPRRGELSNVGQALDQMAATVEMREAERDRSKGELLRQSARSEAMASIAGRLNAHVDLEGVLNTVCQETARALDVPTVSISLRDLNTDDLHPATCCGLPKDFCERLQAHVLTALAPIREGKVALVADTAAQPEMSNFPSFAELGIRTLVGAPMMHEGQLVGALLVLTLDEARQFSEDEIEFLKAISDQAATAVVNARLYESLRHEQKLSARLLRGTISAQEEERKRVARELHDETIQGLIGLILSLDAIGLESAACGQEACHSVQSARSAAQDILEGVRRLIADLRPSLLDDLGLVPAIAWYAERLLQPFGVAVDVECNVEEARLPQVSETALFRIAQEAINNVAKHAGSSKVRIALWLSDGSAVLRIEDDGEGFTAASVPVNGGEQQKGLGLQGIRERVSMLGGEFGLQTAPGQGTIIQVQVPMARGSADG
jgi:signal transduction histidine kinase/HAMP domain-containing protein